MCDDEKEEKEDNSSKKRNKKRKLGQFNHTDFIVKWDEKEQ